jgi:hypothetical protein
MCFGALLSGSIVDAKFTTPDTLATPIKLTELGNSVAQAISAKNSRLKPNDIKISLLATTGCPAGLFVDAATDMDALRKGLSLEMSKGKILFPYIFGRDLHDRAADLFPRKFELTNDETLKLLRDLPVGVFQDGYTAVGPFGALRTEFPRTLSARVEVPGYLCSDPTCQHVHNIVLNTAQQPSRTAPINRSFQYVADFIHQRYGDTEDLHIRHLAEAGTLEMGGFRVAAPEAVIEVVADSFDGEELSRVLDFLLREGLREEGTKEWSLRLGSVIGNPADYARSLERAQKLQLLLLFSDEQIEAAIDRSVHNGSVKIAPHELRERRLRRFGSRGVTAQIGTRGVRLAGSASLIAVRLQELLFHLYYETEGHSSDDLRYLLDLPNSSLIPDANLIDSAVQTMLPEEILRTLVLGNRTTQAAASRYLGLGGTESTSRPELLQSLLWKLGAPARLAVFEDAANVLRYSGDLEAAADSGDHDHVRGIISNLFAATEAALRTALEFSTWALAHDHFLDESPFEFDPAPDPTRLQFIEDEAPTDEPGLQLDTLKGSNTLVPLGGALARLAKALNAQVPEAQLRHSDHVPHVSRETGRPFVFAHTIPFLDLTADSQASALADLRACSRLVADETVLRVRNAPLHGVADFPTAAELRSAASRMKELASLLSQSGLYPTLFELTSRTADMLGRARYEYGNAAATVSVAAPPWAIAPMLPTNVQQLIIVPSLTYPSAGSLRFRLKNRPGKDPYWDGWPRRWEIATHYGRPELSAGTNPPGLVEAGIA